MATESEVAVAGWTGPPASSNHSKRDRKRQQLNERLASLSEKFNRDRDSTYRDQLQTIQVDATLVQRLNPYEPQALDHIAELREEYQQLQPQNNNVDAARTLLGMAGPKFLEYLQNVEDAIEYKDYHLTLAKHEHARKLAEHENVRDYKIETAKREHRALCGTIRDRLINTLNSKKYRLNKEKEALEISDSSALLLHPNQFSITNPASPGGTHSKRATRLRKEADDIALQDSKKRKRNPMEDDGSPAPTRRALDPNSTTPLWQSEKTRVAAKQNGPVYSIDKLFTEKELSMTYNAAALAARKYILRTRVNGATLSPNDSDSGENHENGEEGSEAYSAPMMERQISHATRSTRGGGANQNFMDDKIMGIEGIANFEIPANLDILHSLEPPKMPPPVPVQYMKPYPRTSDHNFPTALGADDINSDLMVMGLFKQFDSQQHRKGACVEATALKNLLKMASTPYADRRYVAITAGPREDPEVLRAELGLPVSSVRDQTPPPPPPATVVAPPGSGSAAAAVVGGVPMSRGSSLGGAAMSRQGSARGKGRKN